MRLGYNFIAHPVYLDPCHTQDWQSGSTDDMSTLFFAHYTLKLFEICYSRHRSFNVRKLAPCETLSFAVIASFDQVLGVFVFIHFIRYCVHIFGLVLIVSITYSVPDSMDRVKLVHYRPS